MVNVSIIILNWNTTKDTIECLESLRRQTYKDYEIILVDNFSRPEEYESLRSYARKSRLPIRMFKTRVNLGFAGGSNFGAKKSRGKYFCFLNNDTVVEKNFLSELMRPFEHRNDIGATVGKLLYYKDGKKTKIVQYAGGKLTFYGMGVSNSIGRRDGEGSNRRGEQGIMSGTFVVPRSVVDKIKELFCEFYFFYFEETDLSWRIRSNGYKIVYIPQSVTYHKGSVSIKANKKVSVQDMFTIRNKYLTFFRNLPLVEFAAVLPVMFVYDLGRIAKHMARGNPMLLANFVLGFTKFLTSTNKVRKPRMGHLSELRW